jgi:hypothetical protein
VRQGGTDGMRQPRRAITRKPKDSHVLCESKNSAKLRTRRLGEHFMEPSDRD